MSKFIRENARTKRQFCKRTNIEVETLSDLKEKIRKEGEEAVKDWQEQFIINYILSEIPNYVEIEISPETLNYYVESSINDLKLKEIMKVN